MRELAEELKEVIGRVRLVLSSGREYLERVGRLIAERAHPGDVAAEWYFTEQAVIGLEGALLPWADDVLKRYRSERSRRDSH